MDDEKRAFSASPVIQKNTPIKRLGLSRKRKSSGSQCSLNAKIPAHTDKVSDSPSHHSQNCHEEINPATVNKVNYSAIESNQVINYNEKINILKDRIAEQEEELRTLKSSKKNIIQLENLTELWKTGCKNAFLHFIQLLKDRQAENIDIKAVLNKLGIWKTMTDNFDSDSEISFSD